MNTTTTHKARRTGRGGRPARLSALVALPVSVAMLLSACGTAEPDVITPSASDTATVPTSEEPTTEAPTSEEPTSEEPTSEAPTTEAPTSEEPTSAEPTSDDPPEEGAGDGLTFAQGYVAAITSGDSVRAYQMLSPEALTYFPDIDAFEDNGIAELTTDLMDHSGELQWAIRSAYEETHDGAQVVSIWGEESGGEPFAHSFAVRKLDGMSWVVDQSLIPSTGSTRLNWLNPGIQEGVDWWVIAPERPIQFALLKGVGGPNVAVTASIDDGNETSQQLREMPTDGSVIYELSDDELSSGLHVVTASWVAEDQPFVHTSATPAMNP